MAGSLVGRKLGSYKITELLGQGGMATVYKGYREDIDRYVAVKVLPPHPGLDQQFVERFKLEARTIARLQHPHILPLYDYGAEDDILYLVMAYIEGGSLADKIDSGPIPPREAEVILRQVAGALDYAHRQGVIHRDIKPDNILLDKEGNALLADFGIVKLAGEGSNLTVTGGLVGTPAYMAPEQGGGDSITSSADVYSLGVVVFEMLTSHKPYDAETPMQIVIKHMTAPIPNLRDTMPDASPVLEMVIDRALAKLPENRYASATEFADDYTRAIHSPDSVAGLKVDFQPTANKTMVLTGAPGIPDASFPGSSAPSQPSPATTTIIQQMPGTNPLVLLGGFAIIAVLILGVVFLILNNRPPTAADADGTVVAETAIPISAGDSDATGTAQAIAAIPTNTPEPTFGRLSFSTTNILGDTVTLQVQNLTPLPGGTVYAAWLKNTVDNSFLRLGTVTVDASGSGVLPPYMDANGRTLPTLFNAIALTYETQPADSPDGQQVAYQDALPPELTQALTQIFITSPDGLSAEAVASSTYAGAPSAGGPTVGLLASALAEADKASQHAGLAQRSTNLGGFHTHNEHTINIINGTKIDYNGNGTGENPGFGVGIPKFVDLMEAQLDAVADAPGVNSVVQANLEVIRVCLENTRMRGDQIVALEQEFLTADDLTAVAQKAVESTQIASQLINGLDANGNGQIEAYEGECGLLQVTTYGLLTSTMNLVEVKPA
ncbi:MAG: serine/threonine-protein kinase [Chloroflexota bacterium]